MKRGIRAELLKMRTTRTVTWLALAMTGLIVLAVMLHGLGLSPGDLARRPTQMRVFLSGQNLGSVFAALAGAVTVTAEFRHGTIRPTFMAQPDRAAVIRAKAVATAVVGAALGAVAAAVAGGLAMTTLHLRDLPVVLERADLVQGVVGSGVAGALWSIIGVGIGFLVRNQVAVVAGLFLWIQVVENLLIDSVPRFSTYMPGALSQTLAGSEQGTLDSALLAAVLLAGYAVVVAAACSVRTARTDVA